jgi:hypothetical protein
MWKVYLGKRFIGIIETNYPFACKYWAEYGRRVGKKYRLVKE